MIFISSTGFEMSKIGELSGSESVDCLQEYFTISRDLYDIAAKYLLRVIEVKLDTQNEVRKSIRGVRHENMLTHTKRVSRKYWNRCASLEFMMRNGSAVDGVWLWELSELVNKS